MMYACMCFCGLHVWGVHISILGFICIFSVIFYKYFRVYFSDVCMYVFMWTACLGSAYIYLGFDIWGFIFGA